MDWRPRTTPRASATFDEFSLSGIRRAAATGIYDIRGFGAKRRVPHFDDLLFLGASVSRYPLEGYREKCGTDVWLGTRFAEKPIHIKIPITIAGMSFGSLSAQAKEALGRGATLAGTSTTTGDGGMTEEERHHSAILVYQVLPSRYGMNPDDLRRAFSLVPEYLRVEEDVVSLSEYASPLGRRFRALKLWATLRCFGREGLQAIIREHVRLAELFEEWIAAEPGWEVCAPRHFSLVCFRKQGSDEDNEAIMRRVNASGEIFLSHTKLDGRFVLRLAIGNVRTTEDDVALAWEVLRREAARQR